MTDCRLCWTRRDGTVSQCHACCRAEQQREADLRCEQQRQWFRDTGHCGVCGQPGVFCLCRKPCPCADMHECGSGLVADPLDVFAETPAHPDQGSLFG